MRKAKNGPVLRSGSPKNGTCENFKTTKVTDKWIIKI